MSATNEPARPFAAGAYTLAGCGLVAPVAPEDAATLGDRLAGLDPWLTLEFPAAALARYFLREDPALYRYTVRVGDEVAGVVCLRYPWLRGPYLEFLGLTDAYQGRGIGGEVLDWAESQASPVADNLWVVASAFNRRALEFYRRRGFREVGAIEALIRPDQAEILLRKRLGR